MVNQKKRQDAHRDLDKLHRKVKELEGRDRINQHLLTVHTLEETLAAILEAMRNAVGLERVVIFLPDLSGPKLEPAAGAGVGAPEDFASPEMLRGVSDAWLREAEALAEQALREGRAIERKGAPGSVAVPMLRLGDRVGVVFAQNPFSNRPLTEEDAQTLAGLTAQAAVAISDARLYGDSDQWRTALDNLGNT